jgi:hypothetical protein
MYILGSHSISLEKYLEVSCLRRHFPGYQHFESWAREGAELLQDSIKLALI